MMLSVFVEPKTGRSHTERGSDSESESVSDERRLREDIPGVEEGCC